MKQPSRFTALTYRDFRLLWFGQLVSTIGSHMQQAAVSWHIFTLLQSRTQTIHLLGRTFDVSVDALGLGGLGLVRVVPIVVFALVGGMLADAVDRRRLMMWTQSVAALLALGLALATFGGRVHVATIYLLTAALAATTAFDNPARQSLVPNLVPREHLANAISLNTLLWQIGTIIGPALAGLLIARLNIGWVYAVNALSFGAVLAALWRMHYRGRAAVDFSGLTWDAFLEGIRFTYRARLIWSTMLLDFFATFFSSARTMLPLVASELLHVGPTGYGILATAQAVGALIAGLVLSLRRRIRHQGLVLLSSVAVYGAATAFFGLSTVFWLSYLFFALTGAADTVSTVIRGTLRQMLTPDHLRGRMTSVNMVFFMGGPQLGELEAGLVASWLGVSFAIVSGGVATILLTLLVAWRYPALRRYDT
nr:MFS transporter [Ardenticatena sp.]